MAPAAALTICLSSFLTPRSLLTKYIYFRSWTKAGYPAIFATEGLFENSLQGIHTHKDNLEQDGYSYSHMAHFVKLGLAFIVELSVA